MKNEKRQLSLATDNKKLKKKQYKKKKERKKKLVGILNQVNHKGLHHG